MKGEAGSVQELDDEDFANLLGSWHEKDSMDVKSLAEKVKSVGCQAGSGLADAKVWLGQLVERVASLLDECIGEGMSAESLEQVLNVDVPKQTETLTSDAKAAGSDEGSAAGEVVKFMCATVALHDDLDKALAGGGSCRKDNSVLTELRARTDVLMRVMDLMQKSDEGAASIRAWSETYVQWEEITISDSRSLPGKENLYSALEVLRSCNMCAPATNAICCLASVNSTEKDAARMVHVAKQYKDALPAACATMIEEAEAYHQAQALVDRLSKKEHVTLTQVITVHVKAVNKLKNHGSEKVQAALGVVEKAFQTMLAAWLDSLAFTAHYVEAVKFAEPIMAAASTGDFTSVSWIQKTSDKDTEAKTKLLEQCWYDAESNAKISRGVCAALTDLPDAEGTKAKVQELIVRTAQILSDAGKLRDILATASFAYLLMQEPRDKDIKKKLVKLKEHWKKHSFIAERMLPEYTRNLYVECANAEPEKAPDKLDGSDEHVSKSSAPAAAESVPNQEPPSTAGKVKRGGAAILGSLKRQKKQ